MSRLSREKKRDQQPGATPIDVRVPLAGECATVAGTTVTATPGEELHQTVLTHLHHLARTAGHTVHATIHDARIGYVVPLEVTTDGASRFTAEPVRMAPPEVPGTAAESAAADRSPEAFGAPRGPVLLSPPPAEEPLQPDPTSDPAADLTPSDGPENPARTPWPSAPRTAPAPQDRAPMGSAAPAPQDRAPMGSAAPAPRHQLPDTPVPHDRPAHPPRPFPDAPRDASPTFRLGNLPEPHPTDDEPSPTHVLRQPAATPPPGSPPAQAPGTVAPPTGEFGPPPVMDGTPALPTTPEPLSPYGPLSPPASVPVPLPPTDFAPISTPQPLPSTPTPPPTPRPAPHPTPLLDPVPLLDDPGLRPTPVRGFDAVAEVLMGEEAVIEETSSLAEPVGRIGEAVREGRTDAAAELAEQVVAEASGTLGPDHPDVLRVRELAAYIAYLGGEPIRATEISLDLAAVQHRAGDAESAYGNMQSAATAWRAVRDPQKGLALGSDLLTLWTEMAAGEGPAAEEPDRLESARARMLRLAERARNANP
ncbi:hypothetical protein AB0D34_41660 [Streptomyces sp. NPDC048420]|uniref:tetratricopeptide repeat protein n=1 Tax=Streptomyces sp. NPDC048420 TaxID=3155755 RepID=UPI003448282A